MLAEAGSPDVPLFERLKFLGIFFSNLDEFFMVRVAGLQAQTLRTITEVPPDGLRPHEQLVAISARAHALYDAAYRLWNTELVQSLARVGILLVRPDELAPAEQLALDERFRTEGKLPATFEVVYGHAWKATASPPALPHGAKVITLHPAR